MTSSHDTHNDGFDISTELSKHFSLRDLAHCGETWNDLRIENLPRQAGSISSLSDLATHALDPVLEKFGALELTFGFCSRNLERAISGRIDPSRDQHAAHELNTKGKPICARLGAAADFLVPGVDMLRVARWVATNTPFDRLYFYGSQRPIHVSVGPEKSCYIAVMKSIGGGRRIPKSMTLDGFLLSSF